MSGHFFADRDYTNYYPQGSQNHYRPHSSSKNLYPHNRSLEEMSYTEFDNRASSLDINPRSQSFERKSYPDELNKGSRCEKVRFAVDEQPSANGHVVKKEVVEKAIDEEAAGFIKRQHRFFETLRDY